MGKRGTGREDAKTKPFLQEGLDCSAQTMMQYTYIYIIRMKEGGKGEGGLEETQKNTWRLFTKEGWIEAPEPWRTIHF